METKPYTRPGSPQVGYVPRGPDPEPNPNECLIRDCHRKAKDGLCRYHAKYFRRVCKICGKQITDAAEERTGGALCISCYHRYSVKGRDERREMQKARRLADTMRRGTA